MEKRLAHAQLVTVANGAADNATQHIAASFITRNHAVRQEEGAGANMIRQHLERRTFHIRARGFACRRLDERLEQVDFVVGMDMLQHRRNALQAHTGIHRRLGQRVHHAVFIAVELHEHVVPDFDIAVAIFLR